VGSVLAAVGTATPETLIAIVALISAEEGSEDVAIGAIVGAPFLLGTLAMGLVGLFAYLYRERRAQGVRLEAHAPTLERDLLFFLAFFTIAGALAWGPPPRLWTGPGSSPSPSSRPPGRPPGAAGPRGGSASGSFFFSPPCSTPASPCAPAARSRGRRPSTR